MIAVRLSRALLLFGLGMAVLGLRKLFFRNHPEPLLRHPLPNDLFVWVARNSRHPLAFFGMCAVVVPLAPRVPAYVEAKSDWNVDCSSFLMTSARLPDTGGKIIA